jgi:hypothetical protein
MSFHKKQLSFKAGDPDRPKGIIEQNKNFVQKRVALKRFFGCFCVPPFRKDNCLEALSILKIQKKRFNPSLLRANYFRENFSLERV